MADPDIELRQGEGVGRGSFVLPSLLAFLPSLISSFLPKIRGACSPLLDLPLIRLIPIFLKYPLLWYETIELIVP